jgi:hypothetical protein
VCYEAEEDEVGRFCHTPPGGISKPINAKKFDELSLDARPVILKVHGAVDGSDPELRKYVITEDDYIHYLSGVNITKVLPNLLIQKLKESQFLFLSYRLLDWNLRVIFDRLGRGKKLSNSWAVHPAAGLDTGFWDERDVEVLDVCLEEFVEKLRMRLEALPRFGGG